MIRLDSTRETDEKFYMRVGVPFLIYIDWRNRGNKMGEDVMSLTNKALL